MVAIHLRYGTPKLLTPENWAAAAAAAAGILVCWMDSGKETLRIPVLFRERRWMVTTWS
jgi:hypothetical protein